MANRYFTFKDVKTIVNGGLLIGDGFFKPAGTLGKHGCFITESDEGFIIRDNSEIKTIHFRDNGFIFGYNCGDIWLFNPNADTFGNYAHNHTFKLDWYKYDEKPFVVETKGYTIDSPDWWRFNKELLEKGLFYWETSYYGNGLPDMTVQKYQTVIDGCLVVYTSRSQAWNTRYKSSNEQPIITVYSTKKWKQTKQIFEKAIKWANCVEIV